MSAPLRPSKLEKNKMGLKKDGGVGAISRLRGSASHVRLRRRAWHESARASRRTRRFDLSLMAVSVVRAWLQRLLLVLLCCEHGKCFSIRETSRNGAPAAKGCGQTLDKRTGRLVAPKNYNPETVHGNFSASDGIWEGDMVQQFNKSADDHLWPEVDGVVSVPYVITTKLRNKTNDVCKAFNMISQRTCISFHERTTEPDYLNFIEGHGCASFVGRHGGPQPVFVGPKCHAGNICHELLHALGFYHEHTRQDRDRYITVLYKNIKKGKEVNFLTTNASTQDLPYDLKSIMHYGKHYFSANGQPTIEARTKGVNIGQRRHLSDLDVQRIQKLYSCGQQQISLSFRFNLTCGQIKRGNETECNPRNCNQTSLKSNCCC